jgi:hypothetical protein
MNNHQLLENKLRKMIREDLKSIATRNRAFQQIKALISNTLTVTPDYNSKWNFIRDLKSYIDNELDIIEKSNK